MAGDHREIIAKIERTSRRQSIANAKHCRTKVFRRWKRRRAKVGQPELEEGCALCGDAFQHDEIVVLRAGAYITKAPAFHANCLAHAAELADPGREVALLREQIISDYQEKTPA